jgi:aspartyl-tRNA synthetase
MNAGQFYALPQSPKPLQAIVDGRRLKRRNENAHKDTDNFLVT